MALPFNNNTGYSTFEGNFTLDDVSYEYVLYLLPIKTKKETNEIIKYFGNRTVTINNESKPCLHIDESDIRNSLIDKNVSAYIKVYPTGVDDNIASGSLQIFNWCTAVAVEAADVWINDVCRVSPNKGRNIGNPVKGLFFFMEQLVIQNLQKTTIKLFIDPEPENKNVLKPKYISLGFTKNSEDDGDICPEWAKTHTNMVMEKNGLIPLTSVIDLSFLLMSATKSEKTKRKRKRSFGGTHKNKNHKNKKKT